MLASIAQSFITFYPLATASAEGAGSARPKAGVPPSLRAMLLALTPSTPAGGYGIREGSRTSGPRVRSTPVRPGPSALAAPPLSLRQDAGFFGRQQDIGPARPVYARPPWSLRPCRTAKRKSVLRLPTLPLRQALREQGSLGPRPASPLPSALCLSL